MAKASEIMGRRKEALRILRDIAAKKLPAVFVHYSCESFDKNTSASPRVTSIAVNNLMTGQTHSFALHLIAEEKGIQLPAVPGAGGPTDQVELTMLERFYGHMTTNCKLMHIVHWNMRDNNYGFPALAHRTKVLKGQPVEIEDSRLIDMPRLLVDIYGRQYAGHPRLESLMTLNKMSKLDFLTGAQEAAAFTEGKLVKMHLSTLRKVDTMGSIVRLVADDTLKVHKAPMSWLRVAEITEYLSHHWIVAMVTLVVTITTAGTLAVQGWRWLHPSPTTNTMPAALQPTVQP